MTRAGWFPLALAVVFGAVAAVLPLLAIEIPGVLPGPTYLPGTLQLLALCLIFAALALSYHLLFGTAGMLSFGHALYFALGAYGLGVLLQRTDLGLVPAIAIAVAIATGIALALGAVSLRVAGISFAMVTLAFAQAGSVLVRRNAWLTGGEEGLRLDTRNVPEFLIGVLNTRNVYWVALVVLLAVFLVVVWFERSRAGHVAVASRENELRVRVLGLRPFTVKLLTFVIASALAALTGTIYFVLQSGATPRATSADFTLTLLVIVVLGGVGSRWGAVVGAFVYTLLDQRLTAFAASDAVAGLPDALRIPLSEPLFILGTLFILVVLFLPGGIAGTVRRASSGRRVTRAARERLEEAE
ncbi:branched-chain amino acid ABC transporter permease [Protaetiibacter sp. 10F1B-8-1]|uniref:Branched-chain amino acid ABC transporter permease n=1 Tax=Protaetiibacter mangrovi TaxID=2970926 RepID=A0ABT1ZJ32_9MICO|nr:branched-chain amino acid ABC transporter permease [Protaetiibacter mangrovi]MCS0500726.1 branched-chain amino acid ABC transporter permease [Protaetiibacter mangrovi]